MEVYILSNKDASRYYTRKALINHYDAIIADGNMLVVYETENDWKVANSGEEILDTADRFSFREPMVVSTRFKDGSLLCELYGENRLEQTIAVRKLITQ